MQSADSAHALTTAKIMYVYITHSHESVTGRQLLDT